MKKIYYLTFILFIIGYACLAQDTLAITDSNKSHALVTRLTRELTLDKNQQDKVYVVLQKRWRNISKVKTEKLPIDRSSINQKTITDLKRILSKEQFDLFIRLKEENKKDRENFMKQNPKYVSSEEDQDIDF